MQSNPGRALYIQLKEFVNELGMDGEGKRRVKMAPRFLAHKTGE